MATKPETRFRMRVRRDLAKLVADGFPIFYEAIQQRAIKGSPDFVLCCAGFFVALELKDEEGIVSKIQRAKLEDIAKCGGMAFIVDQKGWPDVYSAIQQLASGEKYDS